MRIWRKYHNTSRNRHFSYPDRILVGIRDFHWSKIGIILPTKSGWLDSLRLDVVKGFILAVHCQRYEELPAHHRLVLWKPTHGKRRPGRPSTTFVDTLKRDVGTAKLAACMTNRDHWASRRAARLRPPQLVSWFILSKPLNEVEFKKSNKGKSEID